MKVNRLMSMALVAVFVVVAGVFVYLVVAGDSPSAGDAAGEATGRPAFMNVSVHDPMVTKVDDTYYVFGSHLAAAKSQDLMRWEQISTDWQSDNPLVPNPEEALREALEWPEPDDAESTWAKSVIEIDGQYHMYFSTSSWGRPRSAISLAVAEDIEGPYSFEGFVVRSHSVGETNIEGDSYNSTVHPNAIDPHVFYDDDGRLWMLYGSYAGGIFILELDGDTGLPLEDDSFGTRLSGGDWAAMEGPYMLFHPETGYYYYMVSYGSLAPDAGYNIRLARSRDPQGPFLDPAGNDMINADSEDHSDIEPYGAKLIGNFRFEESGISYLSPGHNSALYNEDTGKTHAFFHVRTPGSGMSHSVRVHQLFVNSRGWLVMAPHRYGGEELRAVSAEEVPGRYQFINHGTRIQATPGRPGGDVNVSERINLNSDGSISGAVEGSWTLEGDWFAEITVEAPDAEPGAQPEEQEADSDERPAGDRDRERVYHGVFLEQWDNGLEEHVMTFTALSDAGVAVWGSRVP